MPDHHDLGLAHDLQQLQRGIAGRRLALGALAGLPLAMALPGRALAQAATCSVIPSETAGPFPANGAGRFMRSGPNALALSGIVRRDIPSQLALPREVCESVYANAAGYGASLGALRDISFAKDGVFSDGVAQQMLALSGSADQGYAAALTLGISA